MSRRGLRFGLAFAVSLGAAPAWAQQPPLGASLAKAVHTGDTALMAGLRGTRTRFSGAVVRVYRDTKAYRDYLVSADTALAAQAGGPLELLVRVRGDHRSLAQPPAELTGAALVNDFEMEPIGGKLRWYPVFLLETP